MKNYESPTIEQAGGPGNEIEPQTPALVLVLLVGIILAAYLAAAAYTTAVESVVTVHAAVVYKTAGVTD